MSRFFTMTCAGLIVSAGMADTLTVPGKYATIQDAINAAVPGDTVLIADGVYTGPNNRNLNPKGKAITIKSENGPAACIIDCESAGRGFLLTTNEPAGCLIEGLTIRNGASSAALGAGMYILSSPTVRNCVFEKNDSGIYNGGGIYAGPGSSPLIERCTFVGNSAGGGAALFCETTQAWVISCTIINNIAGVGGAVLCSSGASPNFVNCLFNHNSAPDAAWGGGAVFCNGSSTPWFTNCTFVNNAAVGLGGAMYSNKGSAPVIVNSIIWGNSPDGIYVSSSSGAVTVGLSDIQGGWPGTGNINADPKFVTPGSDYRLSAGSPCIDAGVNNYLGPFNVTLDLAGQPRFVEDPNTPNTGQGDPPVDMGAYEFQVGGACVGDITGDGKTCQADLGALLQCYGLCEGDPGYNPAANLATSTTCPTAPEKQVIDQADLGLLLGDYGCGGCP